jgi:hypothetical protein
MQVFMDDIYKYFKPIFGDFSIQRQSSTNKILVRLPQVLVALEDTELFFYIFASFVMRDLDPMVSSKVKILEGWELLFQKQSLSKQNFEEV